MTHVLAALLGAVLGLTLFLVAPNRRASRRTHDVARNDTPDARFVGGATWRPDKGFAGRASWPLVALELHRQGLVLQASAKVLRFFVPRVELAWADIACAERTVTGVRILRSDQPGAWFLFQLNKEAVLQALRSYPVTLR